MKKKINAIIFMFLVRGNVIFFSILKFIDMDY